MLKYKIVFEPQLTTVYFTGNIDEHVGEVLTEVRTQVKTPRAVFHCQGVNLINSIGISTWIAHLRAFDDVDLSYTHMPYVFIGLCRIIPVLTSRRSIHSFFVRYYCASCDEDEPQMVLVQRDESTLAGVLQPRPCARCRGPMEADSNDLELLAFFKR